jgi:hypothetical protein
MARKPGLSLGERNTFYRLILFQPINEQLLRPAYKTKDGKLAKNFCFRFLSKLFLSENPSFKHPPELSSLELEPNMKETMLNPFASEAIVTENETG